MTSEIEPIANTDTPTFHDEESPLLQRTSFPSASKPSWRRLFDQHVVMLCFILIVLVEIGVYLQMAPLNELVEEIICREYLAEKNELYLADIEDPRCKSAKVQGKLAMLRGWQATFDCIPSILTAIPYGLMSDTYGRRVVLGLSLLGVTLGVVWYDIICWWPELFPVWMTWFSSAFSLIGGGGAVITSMIYTMISDVVPNTERATVFLRLSAALIVGEMIASPASATLMKYNNWLPMSIGLGSLTLATCMSLIFPETLGQRLSEPVEHAHSPTSNDYNDECHDPDESSRGDNDARVWKRWLKSQCMHIRASSRFMLENKTILLLMYTFLVTTLGRFVQEMLMQYTTKRFHWTWSQAAYLLTLRSTSNLLLLLVILPAGSYLFVTRFAFSANSKDLWLARMSCILLLVGALTIGFAMNAGVLSLGLILFSFGGGYNVLVRSLLTSIVEANHVGTLYNTIAVTETIGVVVAGPLLSISFRRGLEMGNAWIGLPFICAGGLFATAAVIVFSVRLPSV